jgi:hypothetical protein
LIAGAQDQGFKLNLTMIETQKNCATPALNKSFQADDEQLNVSLNESRIAARTLGLRRQKSAESAVHLFNLSLS